MNNNYFAIRAINTEERNPRYIHLAHSENVIQTDGTPGVQQKKWIGLEDATRNSHLLKSGTGEPIPKLSDDALLWKASNGLRMSFLSAHYRPQL